MDERTPPRPHSAAEGRRRRVRRSLAGQVGRGFRPDVEGMRALAVIAVVLFHARLLGVSGGFVGVDVFFVLSGFLITRLLLGELEATGTISLRSFWARRARRLLPASALAAVVTAVAAQHLLPPLSLRDLATDTLAAATFSANIVFAHRLGDYFGAQLGAASPSPLLHFWSLAVEEQFYLFWPPLLMLLTRRPRQFRRLVMTTVAVLGVTGVIVAIVLTSSQPAWAFYLLPARMGELLAGAALAALGPAVLRIPRPARAAIGWAGLATIVVCCVALDDTIPWPGTMVLVPVLATAAVIVAGPFAAPAVGAGTMFLGTAPLQWIGRHSYALYLWHWPVLVLAEARWGPLGVAPRLVAIALAIALSALSVRLIENPVRHSPWLGARPLRSLAAGALLCVAVLGVGWDLRSSVGPLDSGVQAAAPRLDSAGSPAGFAMPSTTTATAPATGPTPATEPAAATTEPDTAVTTTLAAPDAPSGRLRHLVAAAQQTLAANVGVDDVPANLKPSLGSARNRSQPYQDGCVNVGVNDKLQPCEYGVKGASQTILLYGDSHAAQWFEPLEQIAVERGFRLVILLKGGCPVADVDVPTPVLRYTCPPYRDRVIDWIDRNEPDIVVASNSYTHVDADIAEWATGTDATIARLAAVSDNVVIIGDNPLSQQDPPACLSANLTDAGEYATERDEAVRPDRISAEVAAAREHGVTFVDTTEWFCTAKVCPPIIGNVLVIRDETHITVPMARFLQPLIDAALASTSAA